MSISRAKVVNIGILILVATSLVGRPSIVRAAQGASLPEGVMEPVREIPVSHEVDVVVVGGTSGGVSAAVAAAQRGAKVFLAAPRPYLGEDLCGTYRLWLDPNETPRTELERAVFAEPMEMGFIRNALPYKYVANVESAPRHKDTTPGSVLTDGKWHSASNQSVQYDDDVTIMADLGEAQRIRRIHIMAYQRNDDFDVDTVTVHVTRNAKQWMRVALIKNTRLGHGSFEQSPIRLSAWLDSQTRFVKITAKKSANASRVLLGEIIIEGKPAGTGKAKNRIPPTPMQVKRALDDALLEANVQFLYDCYPTDLLCDEDGQPAGIVMANTSGRQAVKAKVIIDATPRATVARLAGAKFDDYPTGRQLFKRVVIGGPVRQGSYMQGRRLPSPMWTKDGTSYEATEYTLELPMKDGSFASFATAEQLARDLTWHAEQLDASETLYQTPPDHMRAQTQDCCDWPGAEKIELDVFRPLDMKRLYVLGGCADILRPAAEAMLRPLQYMRTGTRVGAAAADEAKTTAITGDVQLASIPTGTRITGEIREDAPWIRSNSQQTGTITTTKRPIPVVARYDVVVIGGGTAGAPAGIGSARRGTKTLVVEYLHGLGGIGTMGLIGSYYHGYREGFTKEIDLGVSTLANPDGPPKPSSSWNSQVKIEWYRKQLREAQADIWYGAFGSGAVVEGNRVKGVVVVTPAGRGVVLAKAVIDSTGKAVIAAAAGAQITNIGGDHIAVQGTGLPPWNLGAKYTNTDYTFIDDLDVLDRWRAFLAGRKKFADAYDLGQLVDSRERRQIVGDFFLTPMDVYLDRTYPDSVVRANSNFDSHGFTVHPMFMVRPPDRDSVPCYVPFRCLLPKGIEGIGVTGLGVSAHRDVMPVIRMQPDVQNQGYAVGVAAAMAAEEDKTLRQIDIRALKRHLVKKGNLPADVLQQTDSFPLPERTVAEAVASVADDARGIDVIFAQPETALPLLRQAYVDADNPKKKLTYAKILGVMADPTGAATLIEEVRSRPWDKGWNFTGMGQYGRSLSPLDDLLVALGRTGHPEALGPIIEKVKGLGPEHALSHHRAVAMALETLSDPAAAQPLAQLLMKRKMHGYAYTDIETVIEKTPANPVDTSTRENSLRELILARALYRCGDYQGLGRKILETYARDLRGYYARHAQAILKEEPTP